MQPLSAFILAVGGYFIATEFTAEWRSQRQFSKLVKGRVAQLEARVEKMDQALSSK